MTGEWTEEQVAEFERRFKEAIARPQKLRILGLSRRTRFRLRWRHQRDAIAIWLAYNDHPGAAEAVWRLTGAWRRRKP